MSALPPPPPGPSSAPPPPPPPYTGQFVPSAPPSAPKKKTGLIIGAIAVVAVLGVGAFVLMKGDDDEAASDALSTTAMLSSVQVLVERAGADPGDSVSFDRCPAGELSALAASAPPEVTAVASIATDPQAFAYQPDVAGSLAFVNCTLDDASFESGVGIAFGEAVSDFRADLIRVLPEFDLTFDAETT